VLGGWFTVQIEGNRLTVMDTGGKGLSCRPPAEQGGQEER
jgi:hypothetical protein